MNPLAIRLWGYLCVTHAKWQVDLDAVGSMIQAEDAEYYPCGPTGVVAFIGDYLLAAWPHDEHVLATRESLRQLSRRLQARGFVLIMVYASNLRAVKATRRMGGVPLGYDSDGFMHYRLECANFPYHDSVATSEGTDHGQEVAAA